MDSKSTSVVDGDKLGHLAASPRGRFRKSLSWGVVDLFFSPVRFQYVVLDVVLIYWLFHISVWNSPYGKWGVWQTQFVISGAIYASVFGVIALALGYYDRAKRYDLNNVLRSVFVAALTAATFSFSAIYFIYYGGVGRLTLLYGVLGSTAGVLLVRLMLCLVLARNPYRFTVIGSSKYIDEIRAFCADKPRAARLYRFVDWDAVFPQGEPWSTDRLIAAKVSDVVLSKEALKDPRVIELAILLLQARFLIVDEVTFYSQVFEKLPIDSIDRSWVLREGIARRQILAAAAKRYMDIFCSLLAMVVLSPLLLLVGLIIKLSDGGPILFVQPRQGRYFKPFRMYKFRTMKVRDEAASASDGFTRKQDSRVTMVGKFLRPLHLDELPQLLNILFGHMSIVGPRPEALPFAVRMKAELPLYEMRYLVRPGLTGYAQINYGYAMDTVDATKAKLAYDLYYLCNYSFWNDLQIILRTCFFLVKGAR